MAGKLQQNSGPADAAKTEANEGTKGHWQGSGKGLWNLGKRASKRAYGL